MSNPIKIHPYSPKKIFDNHLESQTESPSSPWQTEKSSRDTVEITSGRSELPDILKDLQAGFPDVIISVSSGANPLSDKTFAGLGSGSHLILSEEFLNRMCSSLEEYEKCMSALKKAVRGLSSFPENTSKKGAYIGKDKVSLWSSVPDSPKTAGSGSSILKESESSGLPKFRIKTRTSFTTSSIYTRLAGASSKMQIRSVLGEAHRSLSSLRITASLGETKDRVKAKAAIASLQKLLLRGNKKIRRLDQEELTRLRQKKAAKQKHQKQVLRLKLELERQKTSRKTGDHMLACEGRLDDLNNYWRLKEEYEEKLGPGPSLDSFPSPVVSGSPDLSCGLASANVISTEFSF